MTWRAIYAAARPSSEQLQALERKAAAASDVDAVRKDLAALAKTKPAASAAAAADNKDMEALRKELAALQKKAAAATAAAAAATSDVDALRRESAALAKAAAKPDGKGSKDTSKQVEALRKEVAALAKPKVSPLEDRFEALRKQVAALAKPSSAIPAAVRGAAGSSSSGPDMHELVALREEVAALGREIRANVGTCCE
jgi:polyhydroxyalkanoate synthesis regulator phasin